MGDSFLASYITLAEGEKDPRNLVLSFAIVRVILIEFDIERHVDVSFNPNWSVVLTCYRTFLISRFVTFRLRSLRLLTIPMESVGKT